MDTIKLAKKKYDFPLRIQFLRFILVGIFNTMLAYAVYALALAVGFPYPLANFIALICGIIIGFMTQGKIVFFNSDHSRFWRFLLCWTLIYCVNIAIISKLINLGFTPYAAGAIALPVIAVLSFTVQKLFVFPKDNVVCCRNISLKKYCPKDDN